MVFYVVYTTSSYSMKELARGGSERVWRKRQHYVFRKRSMGRRILWPGIGILVILGLIWLIPWLTLSSVDVEDAAKVEASKDQLKQAAREDQPEQETKRDQLIDEQALEGGSTSPPKEIGISSNSQPPSASTQLSPPVAQTSPAPSPPPPSPFKVEEVPKNLLAPSDYSYYDPSYYDPGYSYYNPNDYDQGSRYYEPVYWDYQPDYSSY